MTLARKVRRYWRATKAAVVDQPTAADPADAAAWRDAVAYVTGETHTHAQAAAVRAACVNLRDAYDKGVRQAA